MFGGGTGGRTAFVSRPLAGFTQQKVETLAVGGAGERLFVGTADGSLLQYEMGSTGADSFDCRLAETLRKVSKERKPVQNLEVVEAWRSLLGIMDGFLVAYDLYTRMPLAQVAESKGCTAYAVHAQSRQVCVGVKKRLLVLGWATGGFVAKRDVALNDQPRAMLMPTPDSCILAYKKEFVLVSLSSGSVSRLLEGDREHRHVILSTLPPLPNRPYPRVLLSMGEKGLLLPVRDNRVADVAEDRLTWSSSPRVVVVVLPYVVSLLANDRVEVHDISSLLPVQSLDVSGSGVPVSLCCVPLGMGKADNALVATSTGMTLLKMVPLSQQVEALVSSGAYDDALVLCGLFDDKGEGSGQHRALLADIDLPRLHERYADVLFAKQAYDDAVTHYIKADTAVGVVCAHFNLFPASLPLPQRVQDLVASKASPINPPNLTGAALNRACGALLSFLQHHRKDVKEAADRAEMMRSGRAMELRGRGVGPADDDSDASDAIGTAVMVDSLLLTCALRCKPPHRDETVLLLSSPNRCHLDSCVPLLASEGPAFVEALLWLYRSKGEHRRALGLLTEERCVAREKGKGWTLAQFQSWSADYLHALWHHKDAHASHHHAAPQPPNPQLAALVLQAAKPLLEASPRLGLSVFITPDDAAATGATPGSGPSESPGSGSVQDVLTLLKATTPRVADEEWKGPGGLKKASKSLFYRSRCGSQVSIPLVSGMTLAIAYLDWLIANHQAPPELHDEFFLLLLTALLSEEKEGTQQDRAASGDGRSPTELGRVFQDKLREFLRTSEDYHPERLLPALEGLPSHFLHEHALLLSKLGRHEEVLTIYVEQMRNHAMAEEYCDEIWRRSVLPSPSSSKRKGKAGQGARGAREDADVYLALLSVYLKQGEEEGEGEEKSAGNKPQPRWLRFLERNYARVDAVRVLQMLPERSTPLQSVSGYLCKVLRHCATERRHKEVVHQLLRVEELKIQQELIAEQSRRVVISESSVCGVPTCRRLIGNTAILCYPNGTVVHFACGRNDLHTCPVTGKRFGTAATTLDPRK